MVSILGYSKVQILDAVREMYTEVATAPASPFHFPVGKDACKKLGYPEDLLEDLPVAAQESFAGVGYPFRAGIIKAGDTVLDIGAGSGTDVLIAGRLVGDQGKVFALDMTQAMLDKLHRTISESGIKNIEILEGQAEQIPLPDNSVDVITSNGVLNLVPDKRKAVAEIFRVLRPGGQVQIADIVISLPVTPDCEGDPKLWAECVVGATVDEVYLNLFRDAGFEDIKVLRDYDYFAYSPSIETQEVAQRFGAHAVELTMRRGAEAPSLIMQIARRFSPRRLIAAVQRRGLWGLIALVLALLACYGTLALVALLSMLGITLAVREDAWAGTIMLFVVLTAGVVASGIKKHHGLVPLVLAVTGAILISYVMFGTYNLILEICGFVLLGIATIWDYKLRQAVTSTK